MVICRDVFNSECVLFVNYCLCVIGELLVGCVLFFNLEIWVCFYLIVIFFVVVGLEVVNLLICKFLVRGMFRNVSIIINYGVRVCLEIGGI